MTKAVQLTKASLKKRIAAVGIEAAAAEMGIFVADLEKICRRFGLKEGEIKKK